MTYIGRCADKLVIEINIATGIVRDFDILYLQRAGAVIANCNIHLMFGMDRTRIAFQCIRFGEHMACRCIEIANLDHIYRIRIHAVQHGVKEGDFSIDICRSRTIGNVVNLGLQQRSFSLNLGKCR